MAMDMQTDELLRSQLENDDKINEEEGLRGNDAMAGQEVDRAGDEDDTMSYWTDTNPDVYVAGVRIDTETGEQLSLKKGWASLINEKSPLSQRIKWLEQEYTPTGGVTKDDESETPKLEELVTVGSGQMPKSVLGTPESPNDNICALKNNLFIDDTPSQEDVLQGNLGDCYFLAAILQVLHYDPNFIKSMMYMVGDDVYTELYHREGTRETGYHWVRKPIAVKWGANYRSGTDGDKVTYNNSRVGARYRLKKEPEKGIYWNAEFEGDTLKFNRTQYYQAAMWVHCLERAFADYAHIYGQYGTGNTRPKNYTRYDKIEGGLSGYSLTMIYGDDVHAQDRTDLTCDKIVSYDKVEGEDHGVDILDGGEVMLESLATLSQTQDGSKSTDMHMSMWAYDSYTIPRIIHYIKSVKDELSEYIQTETDESKLQSYNQAIQTLDLMAQNMEDYKKAPKVMNAKREGSKTKEQKDIAARLDENQKSLMDNTDFKSLGIKDYISLRSTLATLVSLGGSDIYIYTTHAYNIREVHFVDKNGDPIQIEDLYAYFINGEIAPDYEPEQEPAEKPTFWKRLWQRLFGKKKPEQNIEFKLDLAKLKDIVDIDATTVVIQNPHGQTKAVYPGQKEDRKASGTWETSLRELLANTSQFMAVMVDNHRHDGSADVKSE